MKKDYFIFSNGELKWKDNTLYFVNSEGQTKPLPVEMTDGIHVLGQVQLNTTLLNFVSQHEILLHFYNHYGFYAGTFYPRARNVSGHTVICQAAHYLDNEKRLFLARAFLRSGIHHMLRLLRRYKEKTAAYVDTILSEAVKLDEANSVQELMGIEGRIRQIYYQSFNKILNYGFVFESRQKRPPTDPLNALISYGNSLLYSTIVSEIYRTQLDPTISYLHEPSRKRFSLSLDLSEIFKPLIVDSVIIACINNRIISDKHFTDLDGMVLLNEEGKRRFTAQWQEKLDKTVKHRVLKRNVSYRFFIRLECYKLIKHLIGDEVYKPLKAWW